MRGPFGCWNPRRIEGSSTWSLHAEGRALDIGVAVENHQLGWELACDLVTLRTTLGTMRVMWDGHIWTIEHGAQWRGLQPISQQHRDHIHVEQFWRDARRTYDVAQPQYRSALLEARSAHAAA